MKIGVTANNCAFLTCGIRFYLEQQQFRMASKLSMTV